jgi:hypothetical protein
MSKTQIRVMLAFCLLAASILAFAQAVRKPGLWEMTSTMTWLKSPMPPGMTLPPGVQNPFAPTTRTSQVCLTQEMIDKYGAPLSYSQAQESCTVSDVVLKPTSMSAEMNCTGRMNAHATIESSWPSGDTAHGTIHFTGTAQMGANSVPVEYTVETTSTYKGADCGNVKPLPMPASK